MQFKLVLFFICVGISLQLDDDECQLVYKIPQQINRVVQNDSHQVKEIYKKLFGNADNISKQTFIQYTSQIIRKQDYERLSDDEDIRNEIASDLALKNGLTSYTMDDINDLLSKQSLLGFILEWKIKMIAYLINKFKIIYEQEFLDEMYSNADFYGLNYDSYKILTFKFKNSTNSHQN